MDWSSGWDTQKFLQGLQSPTPLKSPLSKGDAAVAGAAAQDGTPFLRPGERLSANVDLNAKREDGLLRGGW